MISDEDLKKLKIRASIAIEDSRSGVEITLAMDPVVVFALAIELLRLRKFQVLFEDTWEESRNAEPR